MSIEAPLLRPPPGPIDSTRRYRITARAKRKFKTPLDAATLIDTSGHTEVTIQATDTEVKLRQQHPLRTGTIVESIELSVDGGRMKTRRLERQVLSAQGDVVRSEVVDFHRGVIPLPHMAYPEVMLPFYLSWQPFDGKTRALYAWINDRFVAKTRYESKGTTKIDLPGGRRTAVYMKMYPDLNDWISLGSVVTRLAKPMLPRYDMWFDPAPPHHVLRYEGPYGPPGAPEIILEIA